MTQDQQDEGVPASPSRARKPSRKASRPSASPANAEQRCRFCDKEATKVRALIAAPPWGLPETYICNECVLVCSHMLTDASGTTSIVPLRLTLAELESRLIAFLARHGRSRTLSFGMIGELFDALDLELDFKLIPRPASAAGTRSAKPAGLRPKAARAAAESRDAQPPPSDTPGEQSG